MPDSKKIKKTDSSAVHRQERGLITRQTLIESARAIFARDGFEHARIEEIASRAGRTRGAFYANFKGKEDVFCAIFEDSVDRDFAELSSKFAKQSSTQQRVQSLCDYLTKLSKDRQRTLLNLEFKLYAIRHPGRRKRLAKLHALMRVRCSFPQIREMMLQSGKNQRLCDVERGAAENIQGSMAIGAIVDGLALNHLFDPEALRASEVTQYLLLCVHAALQA